MDGHAGPDARGVSYRVKGTPTVDLDPCLPSCVLECGCMSAVRHGSRRTLSRQCPGGSENGRAWIDAGLSHNCHDAGSIMVGRVFGCWRRCGSWDKAGQAFPLRASPLGCWSPPVDRLRLYLCPSAARNTSGRPSLCPVIVRHLHVYGILGDPRAGGVLQRRVPSVVD